MSEKYLGEEGTTALIAKIKGFAEPRVLDSPMTIGGVSKTTVDAALSALNDVKAEQVTSIPTATSALVGKVVQFLGTTSGSYKHGYFYECVSDGGDPATYSWATVAVSNSVTVDGSTIVQNQSTGEISAVTATSSTPGIVKPDGDTINVDANGTVNVDESFKKIYLGDKATFLALPEAERKKYDELHTPETASGESELQPKILATPLDIGGTSRTTVESALGALNTAKMNQRMTVVTGNANSLTTVGFYTGESLTNAPVIGWVSYIVTVLNDDANYVSQIAIQDAKMFIRYLTNIVWSDWQPIGYNQSSLVNVNVDKYSSADPYDVYTHIEELPTGRISNFRLICQNTVHSPSGVADTDFSYTVYKLLERNNFFNFICNKFLPT